MTRLNNDWEFTPEWSEAFLSGAGTYEPVRLPHTVKETPLHYADSASYQMICGYRRVLRVPESAAGRRSFLQFDGAAHIAAVYVNGRALAAHRCGYTAFRVEATDALTPGDNLLAVRLDTTENPEVPPFGYVIDYLTFGGLYRDVWMDIRPRKMISDLFVTTPDLRSVKISCAADLGPGDVLRFDIIDPEGRAVATADGGPETTIRIGGQIRPWSMDDPALYRCRAALLENGVEGDVQETTFGFRTAEFRADGFYLNGEKLFLRGLNRHQSYPYIGYAAPESLQREDARILKRELCCNAVRTSHYPQSQYFIDECDRQGLLVFTELPGWQHVGGARWQDQAVENLREMVVQYRNHPSVILWGVRINESLDYDDFYTRTNAEAHALDPGRATSGVRDRVRSSFLEDVYAYNDFSHNGSNAWCREKKDVTPDMGRALLISESVGHMFPTKPFDPWSKRQEHALRHARVMDAAMADGGHAGFFGWCMFDYNTHKDFGSGDRICYHGVLDAFRNPKLAAAVYAAQGDEAPVLAVGSTMDIGEYDACDPGTVWVFSNADEVRLYRNGCFVTVLQPGAAFRTLPRKPLEVTDTVGELLETAEGYDRDKAAAVRELLLSWKGRGLEGLTPQERQTAGAALDKYGLTLRDAALLYGKYMSNWGGLSTVWRFYAVKDGKLVSSVTRGGASADLRLEVKASSLELHEGDAYDMSAVRVRILDGYGNPASYAQLPVFFSVRGDAELVGPATAVLEGGSTGTYIKTAGRAGSAVLTVSTAQTEPVDVIFTIREERK